MTIARTQAAGGGALLPEVLAFTSSLSLDRALIRDMGARSGVPIEPDSQTALLDALRDGVEGVYEGVVPGAGGFDALALLMRDDEATVARVKEFIARWSREKGGVVRLLDVKGEEEGVRREGLAEYAGWVS